MTTGDSSLSVCIQSILASELGYTQEAMEYFKYAVLMDLADVAGNVEDGVHIASIGGTWLATVYGFAGMRDYDGQVSFNPLTIRGQMLEVSIERESVTYSLREGDGLEIRHGDEEIRLSPEAPVAVRQHCKLPGP